jgi:hypothetical protein
MATSFSLLRSYTVSWHTRNTSQTKKYTPLEEENEEMHNEREKWEGKQTARFLHPAISNMAQILNGKENQGQNLTKTQRSVIQLDSEWMNPANDPHAVK